MEQIAHHNSHECGELIFLNMKYRIVERTKAYKSFTSLKYIVQYEMWDYVNPSGGIGLKKSFPFIYLKESNLTWYDDKSFSTFEEAKKYVDVMYRILESYYNPGVDTIVYE